MKTASLSNKRNPTNANGQKAKRELIDTYTVKEQKEYIQGQINEIGNSVEDGQSRIGSQTVNEVCKKKSTTKVKLKAASQEPVEAWKTGKFDYLLLQFCKLYIIRKGLYQRDGEKVASSISLRKETSESSRTTEV